VNIPVSIAHTNVVSNEPDDFLRRVHLRAEPESVARRRGAHRLDTDDEVQRVCAEEGLEPEDLDERLNGFGREDAGTTSPAPRAKALKNLDLGAADSLATKRFGRCKLAQQAPMVHKL
jgi:hypothetical protein